MNKLIVFVLGCILSTSVFATHLGPVVYGVERTEEVLICKTLEEAKVVAKLETDNLDKPMDVFIKKYHAAKLRCGYTNVTYTPLEEVHRYVGRVVYNDQDIGRTTWLIMKSTGKTLDGDSMEIFAFTELVETQKR